MMNLKHFRFFVVFFLFKIHLNIPMKIHLLLKPVFFILSLLALQLVYAQNNNWQGEMNKIVDNPGKVEWLIDAVKNKPEYAQNNLQMLELALLISNELNTDSLKAKTFYQLALLSRKKGDFQTSSKQYRMARIYFLKSHLYNDAVKVIYNEGQLLLMQNLYDSAIHFLDKKQAILNLGSDQKLRLYLKTLYGIAYQKGNKKDSAFTVFNSILIPALEMQDTSLIISTYLNIGMLQNTFDSTMIWYGKARDYAKINSPAKYAELLLKIGAQYNNRDDASKDSALSYLLEAEKNIDNFSDVIFKVQLYNQLGAYFNTKLEFKIALQYFQKAYAYSKGLRGKNLNVVLNNLALTFLKLDQPDSGKYYLDLYSQEIEGNEDDYEYLLYYQTRAVYAGSIGDSMSEEVIRNYCEALKYAVKLEDIRIGSNLINNMAIIMLYKPSQVSADIAKSTLENCKFFYDILKEEKNLLRLSEVIGSYAKLEATFGSKEKS